MTQEVHRPYALNMQEVFIQALDELGKPYPSIAIPDWKVFMKYTGGFRPREFSILCGSSGAGKTTLLANLSAQLLRQSVKHFVMSVETGHTDFMKRIFSVLAKEDLNTGETIPAPKLAKITAENLKLIQSRNIEFSLYEDRVSVERLCADLVHFQKAGCKVAMIDNLNFFMEVTRASDQLIEMDRVIHDLVILCKRIDMHVIMVMHPRKSGGDSTRVESEYDIKGSSTAVQEAHNIFLFNRPHPEEIKAGRMNPFQRELKIAKMRRRGKYVGKTIIFNNLDTCYEEAGTA